MVAVHAVAEQTAAEGGDAVKTPKAKTADKIRKAEQAVTDAKAEHRQAFREALVALFNEYGLCIESFGMEGTQISDLRSDYRIEDLPT